MSSLTSLANGWIIAVLDLKENSHAISAVHPKEEEVFSVVNSVLSMSRQILGSTGILEIIGSFFAFKGIREDFLGCKASTLAKTKFAVASYLERRDLQICFFTDSDSRHSAFLLCVKATERFLRQNPTSPFAPFLQQVQTQKREAIRRYHEEPLSREDLMMYQVATSKGKYQIEKKMREWIDFEELKKALGIGEHSASCEIVRQREEGKFVDSLFMPN